MAIHLLDSKSIDKIAAGEVVENPSSVVKELLENAIDANSTIITVQIKSGGKDYIRVTDNGCGIDPDDLPKAFLRHATSKIKDVDDLLYLNTLGFRGEALSSISAVSKTEIITRTDNELVGTQMLLEGGAIVDRSEIGAPRGTSITVRNLFYNTPARREFLKSDTTETGLIADLVEHLALSNPHISFTFIDGNKTKLYTSGNGNLKEAIITVFGRELKNELIEINEVNNGIKINGFLGKPSVVRSNRNFEILFVNSRYIKSELLSKAIEEGYSEYLMQHKFPFCLLNIQIDSKDVDCNIHPRKMDVRFSNSDLIYDIIQGKISHILKSNEMIPSATIGPEEKVIKEPISSELKYTSKEVYKYTQPEAAVNYDFTIDFDSGEYNEEISFEDTKETPNNTEIFIDTKPESTPTEQLNLFSEHIISESNLPKFKLIGQVFKTYWMIEYEDKLLIVDQHAAHEKVNYERFINKYLNKTIVSQNLLPAIIVSLTSKEAVVYKENEEIFAKLGFEIENFGGNEYKIVAVPTDLFGCDEKELFIEVLDDLIDNPNRGGLTKIEEKIASMSCKAAVKGNNILTEAEMKQLITDLLTLDNPYNCPHGRPTMIEMTKYEMDRKFKRIV